MAGAPVAADVHQPLDVHRDLGPECALNLDVALDRLAQPSNLRIGQVANSDVGIDGSEIQNTARRRRTDTIYVREGGLNSLIAREIHPGYSSHTLSLPLLVLGVALANNAGHAFAAYDPAMFTYRLDAGTDFQGVPRENVAASQYRRALNLAQVRIYGVTRTSRRTQVPSMRRNPSKTVSLRSSSVPLTTYIRCISAYT